MCFLRNVVAICETDNVDLLLTNAVGNSGLYTIYLINGTSFVGRYYCNCTTCPNIPSHIPPSGCVPLSSNWLT
jgi:hypothetical protein